MLRPADYVGSLVTEALQRNDALAQLAAHVLTNRSARHPSFDMMTCTTTTTTPGAMMNRMRDIHQSKAYAARRASLAVDRVIVAASNQEKAQARIWAQLWGALAGYPKVKPDAR